MALGAIDKTQWLAETQKLIFKAKAENEKEYRALIAQVKAESGQSAAFITTKMTEWRDASKKIEAGILSDQTKQKILEGQIAALTREIEALKKNSAGMADIAALKKRLDTVEEKSLVVNGLDIATLKKRVDELSKA